MQVSAQRQQLVERTASSGPRQWRKPRGNVALHVPIVSLQARLGSLHKMGFTSSLRSKLLETAARARSALEALEAVLLEPFLVQTSPVVSALSAGLFHLDTDSSSCGTVLASACMVAATGCLQHGLCVRTGTRSPVCLRSRQCDRAYTSANTKHTSCLRPSPCRQRSAESRSSSVAAAATAAPPMAVSVSERMKELKDQGRCALPHNVKTHDTTMHGPNLHAGYATLTDASQMTISKATSFQR